MKLLKRIGDMLGITPPKHKADITALKDLLELGRHARYTEHYDNALSIFRNAEKLAEAQDNATALTIARLNIADTFISMSQFDDAEDILIDLENETEQRQHHTPLGYTLCTMGYLHQIQDNWELARTYYNRALALAERHDSMGVLGRAKGHLASTYIREGNATYAEHLLREALPLLDQTNDIELSSQFIGQYALAMLQLGRDLDGDRLLETALRRAQRIQHREQIRQWTSVLGQRHLDKQDYTNAAQYYQAFIEHAPTPLPITEQYGIALVNMSDIARHLGHQNDALDYAQQAEAILTQLDSASLSSQALLTIGLAMRANHDYDGALSYFEQAQANATADQALTITLEIAQTHATAGNFEQAQTAYHNLSQQLTTDSIHKPRVHAGLGNTYYQQGKLEQAINEWTTALKIHETASEHSQVARLIVDIAQAHYELGNGKRALVEFERALMLLNSVDIETKGIVMSDVAIAYADKGDVPTTESFFSDAIEIAHTLQNPTAEALRRNNYAMFLIDIGQVQRAIVSIEHAQQLLPPNDNAPYRAIFVDNLGIAFRTLGKADKSLEQHLIAEGFFKSLDTPDWAHLNHLNLVEAYLDLNRFDDAASYLRKYDATTFDVQIQHHMTSARYNLLLQQLDVATKHITKAITQAKSGYRQRLLAKSLILQSQIQAAQGNTDAANTTWHTAEKHLTMLQMPVPNPNWLHLPAPTENE
jgi:tetratricopeptide (TPR) repeat protein